ncbi:MAG: AMP-binding protein, partial [Verrucomicrobia bacterium]|nr:AMP-binding protein [Verrucomicrobiota bacterium]
MKCPLSSHQERLWFIDQFETGNVYPASPTYHNLPLLLHGRGVVEVAALTAALGALVARHGALRTQIATESAGPVQLVLDHLELPVTERTLRPGTDLTAAIEAAAEEAQKPFALATDALVRAALLRFGTDEFVFVATLHHLIADRPSLRLLAEEFAQLMRATREDRAPALPVPELHYADYSEWQRSLPADALEPLLFYWKWQLRGKVPVLELPSARPRPAIHTFTAARHAVCLDAALAGEVRDFAVRAQSGPAAVTLAAFKILLHRYARQDEILVGTSEPCRRQPGAGRLVGPVANLVALRSQLGGNPSFRAAVNAVASTLGQAREHQEMPFDSLVRVLRPENDMSRTALFDVLFGHDEAPPPMLDLGRGATAQLVDTNLGFGKYDLNLALQARADGSLAGTLVYNADLHDEWFIAQFVQHFERLLRAGLAQPDTGIDHLPLLSPAEESRLISGWNETDALLPEGCVHELFEVQVERSPEAAAVVFEKEVLTYGELNARANQLARALIDFGVGPDEPVAVALERSPVMVVALLATLKSGGAYVPLDPEYPVERLGFMLSDSGAR